MEGGSMSTEWRKRTRKYLWEKSKYCHWCGIRLTLNYGIRDEHPHFATIEHIVRKADGGTNNEANLTLACKPCNNGRAPNRPGYAPVIEELCPEISIIGVYPSVL